MTTPTWHSPADHHRTAGSTTPACRPKENRRDPRRPHRNLCQRHRRARQPQALSPALASELPDPISRPGARTRYWDKAQIRAHLVGKDVPTLPADESPRGISWTARRPARSWSSSASTSSRRPGARTSTTATPRRPTRPSRASPLVPQHHPRLARQPPRRARRRRPSQGQQGVHPPHARDRRPPRPRATAPRARPRHGRSRARDQLRPDRRGREHLRAASAAHPRAAEQVAGPWVGTRQVDDSRGLARVSMPVSRP